MQKEARIAIIGAGMGGLATTIFLQRFGYDVQVYEQATKLERLGSGMNLSPHVTRVFRDIGLLDQLLEVGFIPQRQYSRNGYTGEITFELALDDFAEKYGAPPLFIHRGDLQEALKSAVAPDVIQLGKQLIGVATKGSALRLLFADRTSVEADIVVGADGINSRIRELLLGSEPPTYTGEVAYRSTFSLALLGDLDVADQTKWWGDDGRYILVYFLTHARDLLYFVTGVFEPDWQSNDYSSRPAEKHVLREHFAGFHDDVMRVIDAAPSATAWPVLERAPLPFWSGEGMVLIGDACHPMRPHMGQGAAMAIEDGVMLARCIDHFKGRDPRAIFRLYETQRRERATRVQLSTKRSDWMRDRLGDTRENPDWLYSYNASAAPLEERLAQSESVEGDGMV